ncbi:MAG: lipoprotein-releasing system transmembrane subunit LolC, partial [Pseudomonadota bacterium]
ILGIAGGVFLSLNIEWIALGIEYLMNIQFVDASVYYIDNVPSDLRWHEVWLVAVLSLLVTFPSGLYPAWKASRLQPAEALRYE